MSTKSINIKNLIEIYNINNCKNQVLINNIDNFCNFYKQFENVTTKPSTYNNQKYNKYYSTNKSFKKMSSAGKKTIFENDTIWEKYKPINDNTNIKRIINNNLNKISNDNFKIVCDELINEILNIDNFNLIQILNDEIYEKIIFDIKFQELYYKILKKIWTINIYPKITIIIEENNSFFWKKKSSDVQNEQLFGPFNNKQETINDIKTKISLKKYFINKLNKEFKRKQEYYKNIDEENDGDKKFKLKRKCFGPIEIIQNLYKDNHINQIIICDIISSLINIGNCYAIETLNILLKFCSKNIKNNLPTTKIFTEFKEKISKLQPNFIKNFKIKFLLMDIIKYIDILSELNLHNNVYIPVKKKVEKKSNMKIKNIDSYIKKNIFSQNTLNINSVFRNNYYNKINLLKILVNGAIKYDNHSTFIYNIIKKNYQERIIEKQHFREVFKALEKNSYLGNTYYIFKKSCTKLYYYKKKY